MSERLILLPAASAEHCRLVRVPDDMDIREAYRNLTGIIAELQEQGDSTQDDLVDALDRHGFHSLAFELGPHLP